MMINEYGAFGGIRIDRGNRSTRRKPAPIPLCPPQTPHDLTWVLTREAASEIFEKYLSSRARLIYLESAQILCVHGDICSVNTRKARQTNANMLAGPAYAHMNNA
jgi:hypothetical protein